GTEVVATKLAAGVAVENTDFTAVINRIQRRAHLSGRILSIRSKIFSVRPIGRRCIYFPCVRGAHVCERREIERRGSHPAHFARNRQPLSVQKSEDRKALNQN